MKNHHHRPHSREARLRLRRRQLHRGAYLLPSLFTIGNILLGFYGFVLGFRGDFDGAAWMLFGAAILDTLDGRIARLTHTESEFGKQLDSLADVLTFGAMPVLLAFLWGLHEIGREGWLCCAFFLLATAIRLARFNVQTRTVGSRFFVGLPSPAAAGTIGAVLLVAPSSEGSDWLLAGMTGLLVLSGLLMVSTFRYPSFKKIDLRQRWSYRAALGMVAVVLVLVYHPLTFVLLAAWTYAVSGPALWLWGRLMGRSAKSERRGLTADASADASADHTAERGQAFSDSGIEVSGHLPRQQTTSDS